MDTDLDLDLEEADPDLDPDIDVETELDSELDEELEDNLEELERFLPRELARKLLRDARHLDVLGRVRRKMAVLHAPTKKDQQGLSIGDEGRCLPVASRAAPHEVRPDELVGELVYIGDAGPLQEEADVGAVAPDGARRVATHGLGVRAEALQEH